MWILINVPTVFLGGAINGEFHGVIFLKSFLLSINIDLPVSPFCYPRLNPTFFNDFSNLCMYDSSNFKRSIPITVTNILIIHPAPLKI